jgi:hypothetical protein
VGDQIGHARIDPGLHEQRGELSPVMGLMIEQVHDRGTQRMRERLSGVRRVAKIFREPLRGERRDEALDLRVGLRALAP